jgi:hypothetical protein
MPLVSTTELDFWHKAWRLWGLSLGGTTATLARTNTGLSENLIESILSDLSAAKIVSKGAAFAARPG